MTVNKRLNAEELEAIRKRAEAATPGIWFKIHNTDICVEEPPGSGELDSVAYADREIDAEFIAHAREDVPKLLAEIERLQRLLDVAHVQIARLEVSEPTGRVIFEEDLRNDSNL